MFYNIFKVYIMAFSTFSSSFGLSNLHKNVIVTPSIPLSITSILPTQTSILSSNISSDGSSIVFVNGSYNVYVSTNYGMSFTQVANLPGSALSNPQIFISNCGQYLVARQPPVNNYSIVIALSSTYGYYWTTYQFLVKPSGNIYIGMSDNGKYICLCGGGFTGIMINNNYGDSASWVNSGCISMNSCSMSSTGQYIAVNIGVDITVTNSYIYYSSDFGVSFSYIVTNMSVASGQVAYISSTGDFTLFASSGNTTRFINNVYYSNNKSTISNSPFTSAPKTVIDLMNRRMYNNNIVSNESGSLCYFINENSSNQRRIYISTDYLQTATEYNSLNLGYQHFWASANTKYMLVWDTKLTLLTNLSLSYPQVTWPSPVNVPPTILPSETPITVLSTQSVVVTSVLPTQTTMSCANISSDGSSMVFANTLKNVFISNNYGTSFTQVADLSSNPTQICVSNGGQYIVALQDNNYSVSNYYNAYRIALSSSYGYYWSIHEFEDNPAGNGLDTLFCSMSDTGKYICISGLWSGIWVNNNYGDRASWVNNNYNVYANVVVPGSTTIQLKGCSMSSSGQYMTVNIYAGINLSNSYILYSSDFGVTFSLINTQMSAYGNNAYISSTGDFTVFIGSSGTNNVYYSNNKSTIPNGTFISASSSALALMSGTSYIVSNESGSLCYFISGSTIYVSTDYLQTPILYNNSLLIIDSRIWASANTKYMLVWTNQLQLITNNSLSYPQVTWPTPAIVSQVIELPQISITSILPTQTTMSAFNISSNGSSMVFANTLKNVFISNNYGASFTQVANLSSNPTQICVSDNGNIIVAHVGTGSLITVGTGNAIVVSIDAGSTWTTATLPSDIINISMSSDGNFMCATGITNGGIWVNNNYGNNSSWVNSLTGNSITGSAMSSSGRYMAASTSLTSPLPVYFYYSQNYGLNFSKINIVTSTSSGRTTYISSTGECMYLFGQGGGTYSNAISTSITNTNNGIFTPTTTTIKALIGTAMTNNMVTNSSGSKCYFIGLSTTTSIYISSDYLQSKKIYATIPSSNGKIVSSDSTKYMLTWAKTLNCLQLITNNYL